MPSPREFDSFDDFVAFLDECPDSEFGCLEEYFHENRLICEIRKKSGEVIGRWQSQPLSQAEQDRLGRAMEAFVLEIRKPS